MPAAKKSVTSKKPKTPGKSAKVADQKTLQQKAMRLFEIFRMRTRNLAARRPHRSFRRTRRRDYIRPLRLPGYWKFTAYVCRTIWKYKKTFFALLAVYSVLSFILVGIGSQDVYSQINDVVQTTSGDFLDGGIGVFGHAGILLATGLTSGFSDGSDSTNTTAQTIYAVVLVLLMWLSVVWLLRAFLSGERPKLRDALYNAGSPVIPTFLVGFIMVVQLLPVAIAAVGFGALLPMGLVDNGGVEAMAFWALALLLVMLSLYWITSTLIALVIVTLPGMYPLRAIRTAGDLVIGRRIRILFRFLWMLLLITLGWAIVMIPIIIADTWLLKAVPALAWMPIVPVAFLIMGAMTVLWVASYVYLFYRKVVDDDAAPA